MVVNMSEKVFVAKDIKISQKAIFDMSDLYKVMYKWFKNHGFEFREEEYLEKMEPKGKHLEIKWYADKKYNDYVKFIIEIKFLVLGLNTVEVEVEGMKKKVSF